MNMIRIALTTMLLIFLHGGEAVAQRTQGPFTYLPEPAAVPVIEVLPRAGAYYTTEASGSGLLLDVGENGLVFGAFFYTNEEGQRDWLTVIGMHESSHIETWAATGETGRLVAPRLETTGGPAGFNVAGPAGQSVPAEGPPVQLTWYGPEQVKVEWDGRELLLGPLAAVNPGVPLDDRILGEWRVSVIRTSGYRGATMTIQPRPHEIALGQARIEPAASLQFWASGATAVPVPPDSAKAYRFTPLTGVLASSLNTLETRYDWYLHTDYTPFFDATGSVISETRISNPIISAIISWFWNDHPAVAPERQSRIVFNPATGQHQLAEHCDRSHLGCLQTRPDGSTAYQIRDTDKGVRFYWLNHNRFVAREFKRNAQGQVEFLQELVFDRVNPDIEQQRMVGCARVAWDFHEMLWEGVFECGHDGQRP